MKPKTNINVNNPLVEKNSLNQFLDDEGTLLPWFNPPSLKKLQEIINKEWEVFEWGAGASTYWFSKNTKNIISVEHNKNWYEYIKSFCKKEKINNIGVRYKTTVDNAYANEILKTNKKYDLIIIDGIQREECIKNAKERIKDNGWIIVDNSDRLNVYQCCRDTFIDMETFAYKMGAGWGTILFHNNKSSKTNCEVNIMNEVLNYFNNAQFKTSKEGSIRPNKAWILDSLLRIKGINNILEIGFNQGKSSLILLYIVNKNTKVTSMDICKHECAEYNANKIKERFSNFNFIKGDSKDVLKESLKKLGKLDFIIIDGGHDYITCKHDLELCMSNLSDNGIIYVDDYNKYNSILYKAPGVEKACEEYMKKYPYKIFKNEGIVLFMKVKELI